MTAKINTCEGMPIGSVTSSNQNSDGYSGDALTLSRGTNSTTTGTSTNKIYGTKSLEIYSPSGENCYGYHWWVSQPALCGRFGFKFASAPAVGTQIIKVLKTTGSSAIGVRLAANGTVVLVTGAGATIYTTSAITYPGVYQIGLAVEKGTTASDGKVKFALWDYLGNWAGGMSSVYENTGVDSGTVDYNQVAFGKQSSEGYAATFQMDEFYTDNVYAMPSPYIPQAPTYFSRHIIIG